MIKYLFFDLDGTLLNMPSQDAFVNEYFKGLSSVLSTNGYDAKKAIDSLSKGLYFMIKNDGKVSNEEVFWNVFFKNYDCNKDVINLLSSYYENDFDEVKVTTSSYDGLNDCLQNAKEKGYKLILSTNPIFPRVATLKRISWAGLDYSLFDYITTYENSSYCKPNIKYYESIFEKFNIDPKEVIMFGNDTAEDMVISLSGAKTYLVDDCIIDKPHSYQINYRSAMKDAIKFINCLENIND